MFDILANFSNYLSSGISKIYTSYTNFFYSFLPKEAAGFFIFLINIVVFLLVMKILAETAFKKR